MKLTKWLTPLSIASLAIASGSFGLVSCGDNGKKPEPTPPEPTPWTDETPYEYIHNRTFSIERIKNGNVVWGTCWIIDDSTPDTINDYCYYVATNWHVTHGFDRLDANDNTYYYADDSLKSPEGWIEHNNYKRFSSYQKLNDQNFLYKDEDQTNEYFLKGIDLYVCNVNFGDPSGSIKTKLDNLNAIRQEKHKINEFVNGDDATIIAKRKIIGGYPVYYEGSGGTFEGGGKWEFHDDITSDLYSIINRKGYGFKYPMRAEQQIGHPIGQPKHMQGGEYVPGGYYELEEEFYPYDIAPQYHFTNPISSNWMKGGASGSMLITEDCEVCGIYWGGEGSSDGTKFWPYFSLFKTSDYDFTQQWLAN